MQWRFVDSNILEEIESGYQIHLISGTWFHPGKLKPKAPSAFELPKHIEMLRCGLRHIRSIGKVSTEEDMLEEAVEL